MGEKERGAEHRKNQNTEAINTRGVDREKGRTESISHHHGENNTMEGGEAYSGASETLGTAWLMGHP